MTHVANYQAPIKTIIFNPFEPSVLNRVRFTKILILRRILKKISYVCRAYVSVDEKSLS